MCKPSLCNEYGPLNFSLCMPSSKTPKIFRAAPKIPKRHYIRSLPWKKTLVLFLRRRSSSSSAAAALHSQRSAGPPFPLHISCTTTPNLCPFLPPPPPALPFPRHSSCAGQIHHGAQLLAPRAMDLPLLVKARCLDAMGLFVGSTSSPSA